MIHTDGTVGIEVVPDGRRVTIRIYDDGQWIRTWSGPVTTADMLANELTLAGTEATNHD